ncbi:MAG: methylated-DNA--[protein]-cysteine S-methyltransferase [Candidatus Cybelea sp.]|jgi:methylated-DNA-[protein]-cysteine S-methyltransferase
MFYTIVPSPVGKLRLVGSDRGLVAVSWESKRSSVPRLETMEDPHHPVLVEAARQLDQYFAGQRKEFELKLEFRGTDFQKRVWYELLKIPFGETRTYGEIARRLGNVNAMRAVGAANGRNPIPIIAPCHRVIGASGDLVGFGGGLEVKEYLINFERGAIEFKF